MTVAELEPDVLPERAEARQALSDAIAAVDDARARLAEAKAAAEAGLDRAIDIGNRIERLRAELPQLPIAPPAGAVLAALSAGGDVLEVERSPRAKAQAEIEALEASLASVRRARDMASRFNWVIMSLMIASPTRRETVEMSRSNFRASSICLGVGSLRSLRP
jgi:hypothetical protein